MPDVNWGGSSWAPTDGTNPPPITGQEANPGDTRVVQNGPFEVLQAWEPTGQQGGPPNYAPVYGWKDVSSHYTTGGGGGSSGATSSPTDYLNTQLAYQKYETDLALDAARAQADALSDQWQQAVSEENLALQREAEANQVRNNAEIARLNEQSNAISVYSSQLSSRASLANTAANVATTAAEWSQDPRDWMGYLKLQETGLTGGSATPVNAAQYNPETMGTYGTALDQRFENLFGGVGKQLADALAATNETPVAAQSWYESDPNYGSLNPNQQTIARNYSPEQRGDYQNFMNMTPLERSYVTGQGGNVAPTAQQSQDVYAGLSDEGKRYVQLMAGKVPPASMAGGGKMTVNEPTGLVGLLSKRLYATIAEKAPEQVTITPMKEPKQDGQPNSGGNSGVQSFANGGTIRTVPGEAASRNRPDQLMSSGAVANLIANYNKPGPMRGRTSSTGRGMGWTLGNQFGETMTDPTFRSRAQAARGTPGGLPQPSTVPITGPGGTLADQDSPEMKMARQLAATMKPLGIDYTPTPGNYAPPPNLLVGTPWARLQKKSSILEMLKAAASASGFPVEDYLAEAGMFSPTAPAYSGISYGF